MSRNNMTKHVFRKVLPPWNVFKCLLEEICSTFSTLRRLVPSSFYFLSFRYSPHTQTHKHTHNFTSLSLFLYSSLECLFVCVTRTPTHFPFKIHLHTNTKISSKRPLHTHTYSLSHETCPPTLHSVELEALLNSPHWVRLVVRSLTRREQRDKTLCLYDQTVYRKLEGIFFFKTLNMVRRNNPRHFVEELPERGPGEFYFVNLMKKKERVVLISFNENIPLFGNANLPCGTYG